MIKIKILGKLKFNNLKIQRGNLNKINFKIYKSLNTNNKILKFR